MLKLYTQLVKWIDDLTHRYEHFIFTTLAYILAAACIVVAVIYCQRCSTQINMP